MRRNEVTLEGKTALVTGSGRNIGRATALELAKEGANVVINARSNREEIEAVAEEARELGVRALPILADVSDKEQVDSMAARALEEFGRLDVVVSNVAIRPTKPFMDVSLEEWLLSKGSFSTPRSSCRKLRCRPWCRTASDA